MVRPREARGLAAGREHALLGVKLDSMPVRLSVNKTSIFLVANAARSRLNTIEQSFIHLTSFLPAAFDGLLVIHFEDRTISCMTLYSLLKLFKMMWLHVVFVVCWSNWLLQTSLQSLNIGPRGQTIVISTCLGVRRE